MPDPAELKRLRWRCRRGMRELDTLLLDYMDRHYAAAGPAEQAAFHDLLSMPDPTILGLLTRRVRSKDERINGLVERLLAQRLS